jgi:hypothetical protein
MLKPSDVVAYRVSGITLEVSGGHFPGASASGSGWSRNGYGQGRVSSRNGSTAGSVYYVLTRRIERKGRSSEPLALYLPRAPAPAACVQPDVRGALSAARTRGRGLFEGEEAVLHVMGSLAGPWASARAPCASRRPPLVAGWAAGRGSCGRCPSPPSSLARGIPRAAMSPVASGGRTVEPVTEEDLSCAA